MKRKKENKQMQEENLFIGVCLSILKSYYARKTNYFMLSKSSREHHQPCNCGEVVMKKKIIIFKFYENFCVTFQVRFTVDDDNNCV